MSGFGSYIMQRGSQNLLDIEDVFSALYTGMEYGHFSAPCFAYGYISSLVGRFWGDKLSFLLEPCERELVLQAITYATLEAILSKRHSILMSLKTGVLAGVIARVGSDVVGATVPQARF